MSHGFIQYGRLFEIAIPQSGTQNRPGLQKRITQARSQAVQLQLNRSLRHLDGSQQNEFRSGSEVASGRVVEEYWPWLELSFELPAYLSISPSVEPSGRLVFLGCALPSQFTILRPSYLVTSESRSPGLTTLMWMTFQNWLE
jgi:hypothetical protein